MNNNVNMIVDIPAVKAAERSNSKRYVIGGGELTIPLNLANPVTQAITLKTSIPIIMFPLTFIFSKTIITTNARQPRSTRGFFISQRVTSVTG